MPLTWVTDLHLDRGAIPGREACTAALLASSKTPLLITGDISNASRLFTDIETLINDRQLYLVLGNHDHYGSSVARIRDEMIAFCERHSTVEWLPRAGVISLDPQSVMVGVDGWADGKHGEPLNTPLVLNDDRLIAELALRKSRRDKLEVRQVLADADAARLQVLLERALATDAKRIVVATHVPPFVEAIRPGSRADHPDWYPLLICGSTGQVLQAFAATHPHVEIQVLTGHTHTAHHAILRDNLSVTVGAPRKLIPIN